MTKHFHAVVWIDHREARIIHFNANSVDETIVRPHNPAKQVHHKANSIGSGHVDSDRDFLNRATAALFGAGAVLITGPASTKADLLKYISKYNPALGKAVAGVEALDRVTDGELVDFAQRYFRASDHMTPQLASNTH